MAGDAIDTYGKGFHIPTDERKYFTSYTLAAMLLGYIIGLKTIPKYMTQEAVLKYSAYSAYYLPLAPFSHTGMYRLLLWLH
jgi:fucose permease